MPSETYSATLVKWNGYINQNTDWKWIHDQAYLYGPGPCNPIWRLVLLHNTDIKLHKNHMQLYI